MAVNQESRTGSPPSESTNWRFDPAHVANELIRGHIDGRALTEAKGRIFDALAAAAEGSSLAPSVVARDAANGSASGASLIWFSSNRATAADAAFTNAVMANVTLRGDAGAGGHPGAYIVPTALAVGQERASAGSDMLRSVVVGYVVAHAVAKAAGDVAQHGFGASSCIGAFGATATASALMGLSEERTAAALHVACNLAAGLSVVYADGTMEGYLHPGIAARHGIEAARLAAAGLVASRGVMYETGGFLDTFGTAVANRAPVVPAPEEVLAGVMCKQFPVCGLNQETMLTIERCAPKRIDAASVRGITVRRPRDTSATAFPGVDAGPPYQSMLQAQMSGKFTAVATLLGRPVRDVDYYVRNYDDAEVADICGRCELVAEARRDVTIEIRLNNGETIAFSEDVSGLFAPDVADMRTRFIRAATPTLGEGAARAAQFVDDLDVLPQVGLLVDALRPLQQ